jgi:uncharacterized protein
MNDEMNRLLRRIVAVLEIMAAVQLARAAVHAALWFALQPAGSAALMQAVDSAACLITGSGLLLILQPSPAALGLGWGAVGRGERIGTAAAATLLLALVGSTVLLDPGLLAANIHAALVVPVFEELIVRGWAWQRLEEAPGGGRQKAAAWLATSALFAVWHIGYLDIFFLRIGPANPGLSAAEWLLWKLPFTFAFGLLVGAARWRSGKVFGSVLLHGFLNLFGR